MPHLRLLLRFQVPGNTQIQVEQASRIRFDADHGLVLHDAATGLPRALDLQNGRLLEVQSVENRQCAPASPIS